jgi:hypothetical protein
MARGKEATLKERYAAALLHLEAARCTIDPTLQACIDRERARLLTAEQIISHFEVDHVVPKAFDGSNHPTNLNPIPKGGHRTKTAKKDVPLIAKTKRLAQNMAQWRNSMTNKLLEDALARSFSAEAAEKKAEAAKKKAKDLRRQNYLAAKERRKEWDLKHPRGAKKPNAKALSRSLRRISK